MYTTILWMVICSEICEYTFPFCFQYQYINSLIFHRNIVVTFKEYCNIYQYNTKTLAIFHVVIQNPNVSFEHL